MVSLFLVNFVFVGLYLLLPASYFHSSIIFLGFVNTTTLNDLSMNWRRPRLKDTEEAVQLYARALEYFRELLLNLSATLFPQMYWTNCLKKLRRAHS